MVAVDVFIGLLVGAICTVNFYCAILIRSISKSTHLSVATWKLFDGDAYISLSLQNIFVCLEETLNAEYKPNSVYVWSLSLG